MGTRKWLIGTMLLLSGCEMSVNGAPAEQAAKQPADDGKPAARVQVVSPVRKALNRISEQPGEVAAMESAPILAKVPGYVQEMKVDIGDLVKKDQLLATLFAPELELDLKQKQALLLQAQAGLAQAQARRRVAEAGVASSQAQLDETKASVDRSEAEYRRWESELERVAELVKRSAVTRKVEDETRSQLQGANAARREATARVGSAEAAVNESQAKLDASAADIQAAEAGIAVAQANAARDETMLQYAQLRAPFDGVVTQRGVHTGHFVPAATGGGTKPLFTIQRADVVRVFLNVPEVDAPLTNAGDPASIKVSALGGAAIESKVTRTASAIDPETRTLLTEIDVPNTNGKLRCGMYVNVAVMVEQRVDALVLPATAVFNDGGQSVCSVFADGVIVRKPVVTGLKAGPEIEIVSGLDARDQVVLKNGANFIAGQRVEMILPAAK